MGSVIIIGSVVGVVGVVGSIVGVVGGSGKADDSKINGVNRR